MKFLKKILILFLPALIALSSCSETDEATVIDTWVLENQTFISSIAAEAAADTSGEWKVFLAYGLDESKKWSAGYYVYCKVIQSGTGTGSPSFNDVVSVNYSGRLMNDVVFSETYTGEFVPGQETPVELQLESCVSGFITALQEMVRGDVWEVYIPATLGYGSSSTTLIPAGSALIYTINLVDFVHKTVSE